MKKIFLKHKKLLVRIGSILACFLLVGALVLPCFALSSSSTYREVVDQYVADNNLTNPAYTLAMDSAQALHGDNFNYWLSGLTGVITGNVYNNLSDEYVSTSISWPTHSFAGSQLNDLVVTAGELLECTFALVVEQDGSAVNSVFIQNAMVAFSIQVDILHEQDGSHVGQLMVVNADNGDIALFGGVLPSVGDSFSTINTQLTGIQIGESFYSPSNSTISMFFGASGSAEGLSDNARVFLNDDIAYPFSPKSLLTGWVYGSNAGGGASQEELDAAYDLGFDAGFEAGFADDLIGDTFSAPFNALSRFTLFKWEDPVGNEHVITLMGVIGAGIGISLFIWFLKLFAGG